MPPVKQASLPRRQPFPQLHLGGLCALFLGVGVALPHLPPHPLFSAVVPPLAIIGFALPGFWALWQVAGRQKALIILGVLSLFAFGIEALSITTGFPYSKFVYGSGIGWLIGGLVPWTVPFAWIPLVLGTMAYAAKVQHSATKVVLLSALALVAIDLTLDPAIVAMGFWTYANPNGWFDVPLQNFFGWLLSGSIASLFIGWMLSWKPIPLLALRGLMVILSFWSGVCLGSALVIPGVIGILLGIGLSRFTTSPTPSTSLTT